MNFVLFLGCDYLILRGGRNFYFQIQSATHVQKKPPISWRLYVYMVFVIPDGFEPSAT